MLIEGLEIAGLGRFRERVVLGPLQAGLNILAQPNEWGKSTVVQALCHAFFHKYGAAGAEIEQLRPAGTSLSPEIAVTFEVKDGRFRVAKRFLEGKRCELHRWDGAAWQRTDESDKADQRLRELLGAPPLEGRKAKPETWGLIQYLWCRQDDPADWPCWDGDCGAQARSRLATVEIDSLIRALVCRCEERAAAQFTDSGRVKKGGPLQLAEVELQEAGTLLEKLRQRRAELEGFEQQRLILAADLPRLQGEHAQRVEEAARLREEAAKAERLTHEISLAQSEWQRAEEALRSVSADRDTLARIEATLASDEKEATGSAQLSAQAVAEQQRCEALALEQKRQLATSRQRSAETRQQLVQVRALLERRRRAAELAEAQAIKERVTADAEQIARCEQNLLRLPKLDDAGLKEGRKQEARVRELTMRLQSAGLAVQLRPLATATVQHSADGARAPLLRIEAAETAELRASRALEIDLGGWGRLVINSGAEEAAQMQVELEKASADFQQWLATAGVPSLARAEALLGEVLDWARQLTIAQAEQKAHLGRWPNLAELDAVLVQGDREMPEQTELELRAQESELTAREHNDAVETQALEAAVEAAEKQFREAQKVVHDRTRQGDVAAERARQLQEQRAALQQRYAAGLATALAERQTEFVRSEARVAALKAQLPPEAEKLTTRALRATAAAADVENDLHRRRREGDRLSTLLEAAGGEELHARQEEAAARLEKAQRAAEEHRRDGLAARLLAELLRRREQGSIRAVLRPLEDRLSRSFAQLTGDGTRRVWFDEHLKVKGVGPRPEELIRFEDLSRGAREQLLLALRAAIALEVTATEGPQCLVLDDVLVHTDAQRHENVLDFLQELSTRVQILLLTCHAERYRGLGHVVPVVQG